MTALTFLRTGGLTPGSSLTTRDTVFSATPATRATSFIVAGCGLPPEWLELRFMACVLAGRYAGAAFLTL
ncbi:hypothetical protein KL86PLE_100112 [uncultured Pleomorphomonas sp.]|uniref:Uncharacterized protein n=1 Tax=uncultured Pleomorphomonas sp. TaxID=442121 RepID=A0A212L1C7_9HYPH|nr:hypothetical protein KL86PLE_100112 [uncultured Pleomorphomonas sp.]